MRILPCPALCVLALAVTACAPFGGTPGTTGDLGNGIFSYKCSSDSDPVCDDSVILHEMPAAIAVGSRFIAVYTPSGEDGNKGTASVFPASRELIIETETFGSSFKAVRPGTAALLAQRGTTIVDFVHVRLASPAGVRIDATDDPTDGVWSAVTTITVKVDEPQTIRAGLVDEADELLAGALSAAWTSEDSAVAEIVTLPTDNRIQVQGKALGETKLRVSLGDQSGEIVVKVVDGSGGVGGGSGGGGGGGSGGGAGGAP